tara:strand:- start:12080 stop:12520 length:441 start_codon:yes stop_codon:yes gene_type:complete
MIGFILALIYFAWQVVINDAMPIETTLGCLGFLWTWHVVWLCIWGAVFLVIALVGGGAVGTKVGGGGGAIAGLATAGGLSILFAILFFFSAALCLGGVYCLETSMIHAESWEDINHTKFWIGVALYGLYLLGSATSSFNTNSKKSD